MKVGTPPFKIKTQNKIIYLNNIFELFYNINVLLSSEKDVQRYKGLGEMNPEQLWETTMNPKKRLLFQVNINNIFNADQIFSGLMGNNIDYRKEFVKKLTFDLN